MLEVLGDELSQRKLPESIHYGSDCSGVDAPMWALHRIITDIFQDRIRAQGHDTLKIIIFGDCSTTGDHWLLLPVLLVCWSLVTVTGGS